MNELTDKRQHPPQDLIVVGEFLLDRETIRVWHRNKPLQLSLRQFRMIELFMQHPGEPLPRKILKERIWGANSTIEESTVDAEIVRLRRAIGGAGVKLPFEQFVI